MKKSDKIFIIIILISCLISGFFFGRFIECISKLPKENTETTITENTKIKIIDHGYLKGNDYNDSVNEFEDEVNMFVNGPNKEIISVDYYESLETDDYTYDWYVAELIHRIAIVTYVEKKEVKTYE